MNLKLAKGKVPVPGNDTHPWILVDFPSQEEFNALYGHQVPANNLPRYWKILQDRAAGASFADAARVQGVSLERVRQIEAKFLRLMARKYQKTVQA